MTPSTPQQPQDDSPNKETLGNRLLFEFFVFVATMSLITLILSAGVQSISYSEFLSKLNTGAVREVVVSKNQIFGKVTTDGGKQESFSTYRVDPEIAGKLQSKGIKFSGTSEESAWTPIFWTVVIVLGLLAIAGWRSRQAGASTSLFSPFAVERNKARIYTESKIKVTFADVAGADEAKEELQEVIDFLKNPNDYSKLGGRLPKGILLVGPPGTGKTLLAKAVAGEAGVLFFSISGSEFVELFVGVGAARVRDLFAEARRKAPCIIFIDELDALGRSRSINPLASHDEKEQTLNQLLVEMDGFDTAGGVILLAATNRPEILDQALLRAGRFDRHVVVDRPDRKGRSAILAVHCKKIVMDLDVDLNVIADLTSGFTGADLANIVNEAALLASRHKEECVRQDHFEAAVERVIAGVEKKGRILNTKEKALVAYHEIGHALVTMCVEGTAKVQKVSIIPHGIAALGFTVQRPIEDRRILSRSELKDKLATLLGGRAAEALVFGEVSTGAADDLEKATELARAMVTRYGMDEHLGMATLEFVNNTYLDTPFKQANNSSISPETAIRIDLAVRQLLDEAFDRATSTLVQNRSWLVAAADKLVEEETLSVAQIEQTRPAKQMSALPVRPKLAAPHPALELK